MVPKKLSASKISFPNSEVGITDRTETLIVPLNALNILSPKESERGEVSGEVVPQNRTG